MTTVLNVLWVSLRHCKLRLALDGTVSVIDIEGPDLSYRYRYASVTLRNGRLLRCIAARTSTYIGIKKHYNTMPATKISDL